MILPDALRDVTLGPKVLEIGPGPGFTTDVLRKLVEHLTVVEVDPDLADALSERLLGTNVEVVRGDATAVLDLPDQSFTGAASFHMLHHIDTVEAQDRAMSELARVLKDGGVLVAADGVESEASRAFHEGDIYNPIDPGGLERRLRSAGFSAATVGTHDLFGWFSARLPSETPRDHDRTIARAWAALKKAGGAGREQRARIASPLGP